MILQWPHTNRVIRKRSGIRRDTATASRAPSKTTLWWTKTVNHARDVAVILSLRRPTIGLHNSELDGTNYRQKFAAGRKSLFQFDVEMSLWYGRNSGTIITYSRTSFGNIFSNWETSRGPQEKLSRAVCCAGLTTDLWCEFARANKGSSNW